MICTFSTNSIFYVVLTKVAFACKDFYLYFLSIGKYTDFLMFNKFP